MDVIDMDLFFLCNVAFWGLLLIYVKSLKNLFVEFRNQNITESINMKALISNQNIILSHVQNELKKIMDMENEIRRLMEEKKTIIIERTRAPEPKQTSQVPHNQQLTVQRPKRIRIRKRKAAPKQLTKQLTAQKPLLLSNTITPLVEPALP